MTRSATLRVGLSIRHHQGVEDIEATQLMLEALFDVKAAVYEIHDVVVGEDEDEDEEETEEDA